jgi:hypothetical protein
MRIDLDVKQVEYLMRNLMAEVPELAEDEALRLDTLEGNTEGVEVLRKIVVAMAEADAMASGLQATIEQLTERQDRFARKVNGYRSLIQRIMQAADVSKVPLPEATLSMRPGVAKVIITDEDAIPAEFKVTKTEVSRSLLKEALRDGVTVDGAFLSNGEPSLSVRVS